MQLSINAAIFPLVISTAFSKEPIEKGSADLIAIDLPRGANLLYLQQIHEPTELDLLKKYANKSAFSDTDYEEMFKLFLNDSPRNHPMAQQGGFLIESFGVTLDIEGGQYKLIDEYLLAIQADTWEYITLDLMSQAYFDIIHSFDFGDVKINLGSWKTETDEIKQSLLYAFRSAFMFTLVGYLYGDNKNLYASFRDYFDGEFYKRIVLINGLWKSKDPAAKIEYIPIFDSFYNLNGISPDMLIRNFRAILDNPNIVQDERQMIRNRLVEGAAIFHQVADPQREAIEAAVVKRVINTVMEIQAANEEIAAAQFLLGKSLFNQSIHNSYYSMMHALKAFLEKQNALNDWEPTQLNVRENHRALENKLDNEVQAGRIDVQYLSDFRIVKQRRWAADYSICAFARVDCKNSIQLAQKFLTEIQRITK